MCRPVCRNTSWMPSFSMSGVKAFVFWSSPRPHWSPQWTAAPWAARNRCDGQMKTRSVVLRTATAILVATVTPLTHAANTVAEVLGYQPGTGIPQGYDQTSSILGEPSRVTPGDFGGPVDPFNAPWQAGQLLSVGAGGSVTVRFENPVLNLPQNPFGLDFLVFGSSAFVITNGDFTGGGITDGSLFGNAAGSTRISVSADGAHFYSLNPTVTPGVDGLFPTDGSGDFTAPVDPSLRDTDFSGLGLAGIRALYGGSGGGAGFDIDWAIDPQGNQVALSEIQFIRIDVLSDRADIDAIVAIPEPRMVLLLALGLVGLAIRRPGQGTATNHPVKATRAS